jgi:hypothetical protein
MRLRSECSVKSLHRDAGVGVGVGEVVVEVVDGQPVGGKEEGRNKPFSALAISPRMAGRCLRGCQGLCEIRIEEAASCAVLFTREVLRRF